jgi:hypothetical protein
MRSAIISASIALALVLTACSPAQTLAPDAPADQDPEQGPLGYWGDRAPLVDEQGAVTVEITPLNLDNPGKTLDFQISMDTHSVDLSMDLAALATLTTDNGMVLQASLWDAPLGGHHVSGKLFFPAETGGFAVLDGASVITLKLTDVDADVRVFVWEK